MNRSLFRLSVLLILAVQFTACSDSSDTVTERPAQDWRVAQLRALQPFTPDAELAVDAVALAAGGGGGLALLLDAAVVGEPAIIALGQQLRTMAEGFDAAAQLRRVVYSLHGSSGPEYLLLADTEANSIADLYGDNLPELVERYADTDLYSHPSRELNVAMLPGALFAVGAPDTLRTLVDTLNSDAESVDAAGGEGLPIEIRQSLPGIEREAYSLSLWQATALYGGFQLDGQALTGNIVFSHPQAEDYISRFNALVEGSAAAPLALNDQGDINLPVSLPLQQRADRFAVKQLFQGFDGVSYADQVAVDGKPAWLTFDVGTNPNSIFINFEFAGEAQRQAFEANELPAGFRLAPLRILADDEPTFFLVLNIYQSSGGLVEGARAEWSVFVDDPDTGEPRFLVIQAAAESISADPVNLLTFPEPVSHLLVDGEVQSYVGEALEDGTELLYFRSAFPVPDAGAELSSFAREFVAANDFIFWGNGVADRGVFNGTVFARQANVIAPQDLAVEDNSRWAQYLLPQPVHTLIYQNQLDIIISPWWNLNADYLDVTPAFRQELVDFSNAFYPMTALGAAEQAFLGERNVVLPTVETGSPGSLYLHFRVADPQGLAAALALPETIHLAPVALVDGATPETLITLLVSEKEEGTCGLQAQWLTYVETALPDSTHALRLATQSARPCLDADTLLQPGARVAFEQVDAGLNFNLANLDYGVSLDFDATLAVPVLPSLAWLAALDETCSIAGVCDRRFIDGGTLNSALLRIDPSALSISLFNTPWSGFVEPEPIAVWGAPQSRLVVETPWHNVLPSGAP